MPWHWHPALELFYVESGAMAYDVPGGSVRLPAGAGGLVRAYSRSVQVGLAASKIIEKTEGTLLSIRTDYNGIGKIQYLLGQRGLTITDSQYTDIVELETLVPQDQLTELKEAITEGTNGRAAFTKEEAVCFAFVDGEPLIF